MIAQFRQAAQGLTQFASSASRAAQATNTLRNSVRNTGSSVNALKAPTTAVDRELAKLKSSGTVASTAMRGVVAPANQATRGLDGVRRSAQSADGALSRIRGAGAAAGAGLNQARTQAAQADTAFAKTRGGADQFNRSLDGLKGSSDRTRDSLRTVKTHADDVERSVGAAGRGATAGGTMFGQLKEGLLGAEIGQKGLNTAMKASAIGALMALLLPLIEKFDLMGKVTDLASKAFVASIGFMRDNAGPILSVIANMLTLPARTGIKALNFLIDGLNKINVKVPGWVPGIGGKSFGIHIDPINEIPALASGGVVPATPGGRLALIGEGGQDEAVIPLSRLDSMLSRRDGGISKAKFDDLLDAVRALAAQPVVVAVDGQAIARANRLGERQLARR